MTTCKIARRCYGEQTHVVRLATFNRPVTLCSGCLAAARTLGMDPQAVPAWMARNMAKDFTGVAA